MLPADYEKNRPYLILLVGLVIYLCFVRQHLFKFSLREKPSLEANI